jgi:hypothetical protein
MGPTTTVTAAAAIDDSTVNPIRKVKTFTIPSLASDGTNWVTWKQQTLSTLMLNKGIQRHLEGSAQKRNPIPTYPDGYVLTNQEVEDLEKLEEKWDMFNQREAMIKAQVLTTILLEPVLGPNMDRLDAGHPEWNTRNSPPHDPSYF